MLGELEMSVALVEPKEITSRDWEKEYHYDQREY
jgi:hypothetical protein